MNSWNGIGRLVAVPDVKYVKVKKEDLCIAHFKIAIDRIGSEDTDFIPCTAFGKTAEFVEKYFTKGMRVGVSGSIQTGSYENKEGDTVYTTEINVKNVEFADSKKR